ncbi:DICT sensory domain-containing protein [Halococcoides cellulosivorans]|uniref:Histidine kinase n=1 Tax=Halococcoides cellulosivorans TaxID=1679096 RepID=A0A2R4X1H7_9EURY|nr:DICT sensory domain-containing protein [Halococcoides cellulosivorans]AWB27654.1 histidine kinase [Halococcoides cellulosivorans]
MRLREIVDYVESMEKQLVLFNLPDASRIDERLEDFFETQNVRVRTARTASGRPANVAVLSDRDGVRAIVTVDRLRDLVEEGPSGGGLGAADAAFEPILEPLKETTFTAYDRTQMLATSREIEDRARRVGRGTIHAGFQRTSLMARQASIYRDLSERGLTVHTYGVPDGVVPELGAGTVHTTEADEIAQTWFVVFDGGGNPTQKSALLAEERRPGQFYGVWTYDGVIVDRILDRLETAYSFDPERQSRSRP